MPKFSIIVPIYNVEQYIRQCFESIEQQTYKDFEVLCIDDSGSDNSISIAQEFANKDSRFKIFHHEKNMGVSAARNTALNNVTGEYIVFIDPDDWVEINFLEEVYRAFSICSEAGAVWVNSSRYNNSTGELITNNFHTDGDILLNLNAQNIAQVIGVIWDKVYKTDNLRAINFSFPEGLIVEDDELNFKYFSNYNFVYRINKPLYIYRENRAGSYLTEDKSGKRIKDQLQVFYNIYSYAKSQGTFNKYKKFFLKKLANTVNCILLYKGNRMNIIKEANYTLKKINFPEDFTDLDIK